jgi:amino acid transporter
VVAAGIVVALLVLCYAQAASYFDEPGGSYLYAREAFGRFAGFEIGWMIWLTRISSAGRTQQCAGRCGRAGRGPAPAWAASR